MKLWQLAHHTVHCLMQFTELVYVAYTEDEISEKCEGVYFVHISLDIFSCQVTSVIQIEA